MDFDDLTNPQALVRRLAQQGADLLRLGAAVLESIAREDQPASPPSPAAAVDATASEPIEAAAPPAPPKDLDDTTIARKVESAIYRSRSAAKGKLNVNVVDGVVYLRGEAKNPTQVKRIVNKAAEVPEVVRVENLLHLPHTPPPTRTDIPPRLRKSRRRAPNTPQVRITDEPVTAEAPPPPETEAGPEEHARQHRGRTPAPMGSHEPEAGTGEAGGPSTPGAGAP